MLRGILTLFAVLALAGCPSDDTDGPRTAGPHADEYNKVTYWKVIDAPPLEYDQCTDSATWRGTVSAPEFSANSYVMYMVNDATTAAGQSCDTTAASSCSDSGRTWNVSGSTLTYTDDPSTTPQPGYACSLQFDNVWTVVDSGTTATMRVDMNISLVPETPADQADCDALNQAIADEGTNELGFHGCKITIPVNMEYFKSEAK